MYSSHNYTGPGWNNSTPPPVNASNLQDISSALEDLNITQEQLEQLGVSGTLGDILTGDTSKQYCWKRYKYDANITYTASASSVVYTKEISSSSHAGFFIYYDNVLIGPNGNLVLSGIHRTMITPPYEAGQYYAGKYFIANSQPLPNRINENTRISYSNNSMYISNFDAINISNQSDGVEYLFSDVDTTYPKDSYVDGSYYQFCGNLFSRNESTVDMIKFVQNQVSGIYQIDVGYGVKKIDLYYYINKEPTIIYMTNNRFYVYRDYNSMWYMYYYDYKDGLFSYTQQSLNQFIEGNSWIDALIVR